MTLQSNKRKKTRVLGMLNHKAFVLFGLTFCLMYSLVGVAQAVPTLCVPNFNPNLSGLQPETLQVVTWYDGHERPPFATLHIRWVDPAGTAGWIVMPSTGKFTGVINTCEYDLNGAYLTGEFKVSGVRGDGVIDGLAFGLYWRDAAGHYHVVKSTSHNTLAPNQQSSTFVGSWPLGISDLDFNNQVETDFAKEHARMAIFGARYLGNGTYHIPIY